MERKFKHLELIQGVINRMAGNSFALKGWGITLVVGIFALAGKEGDKLYFLIAYIPILAFWGLDSYYLYQERLYRALYEKVRLLPEAQIDFSMNVSAKEIQCNKITFSDCLFSKTEMALYLSLVAIPTVAIICAL